MPEQQHTTGPWFSKPCAGFDVHGQSIIVQEETGQSVAICYGNSKGDAALIAAAPALLASCIALLNCIDTNRDWNEAKAARAAIYAAQNGG